MPKIRLMIVDDSLFFRTFLTRAVGNDLSIEIVGSFGDPVVALKGVDTLKPDVIALDMEMPRMRGDEFLRAVLPTHPKTKTIVISSLSGNIFDAMQAGAIDFVPKPGSSPGYGEAEFIKDIIAKIKIASTANIVPKSVPVRPQEAQEPQEPQATVSEPLATGQHMSVTPTKTIVAIGASTGGTEAIIQVVKNFPANAPGVVVVQHMPPVFTRMYAERVNSLCAMKAVEAKNGERIEKGTIYIAPGGDRQMYVRKDVDGYYILLKKDAKVSGHCPSVDVLFSSVAEVAGKNSIGVLLTGMGADGANGLLAMKRAGAHTIAQDEATCVVFGMPMEALKIGAATQEMALSDIGSAVIRRF